MDRMAMREIEERRVEIQLPPIQFQINNKQLEYKRTKALLNEKMLRKQSLNDWEKHF
jgi:hypothetical protein